MKKLLLASSALLSGCLIAAVPATAQQQKSDNVRVVGHVLQPAPQEPSDEFVAKLKLPDGFRIAKFAEGLKNPRMIAVAEDGTVYVTRRSIGDLVMLRDDDGDGKADVQKVVASRPNMHGIAIDGRRIYLTTVKDVYVADLADDGTLGALTRIIDDLPDGGQHPNRTIAIGPDGKLYITVGSTCNACDETNVENATILQAEPDGSSRRIYATGLRNTIGFGWQPETGQLYGADHGIDWLGDNEQNEEFNRLEEGKQYGWPYVYEDGKLNPADEPPGGITGKQWAEMSDAPVLTYTAHAAPMQLAFYTGGQFPADYRGDAFIAMRGSWNRKPPSGYEVVRIRFEDGKPAKMESFASGWVRKTGKDEWSQYGRLAGLAVARDGALLVGDDLNGVIYRISYQGDAAPAKDAPMKVAAQPERRPEPMPLVLERVKAKSDGSVGLSSPAVQQGQPIDPKHSEYAEGVSPALNWSEIPEGTESLVLIAEDSDAAKPKPFVHWVAYNIPADTTGLPEGVPGTPRLKQPEGMMQGKNSYGSTGYFGMKPPAGDPPHHYHFQLFALDKMLDLKPGAARDAVVEAMDGHVLAQTEIVGTFQK